MVASVIFFSTTVPNFVVKLPVITEEIAMNVVWMKKLIPAIFKIS